MKKLSIDFVESIEEIGSEIWNGLAGIDNPFTRYEFLHALEVAGCTTDSSGWKPYHTLVTEVDVEKQNGHRAIAVMPLYLKTNSWGEYVFDWSWAEAYTRHGMNYFPKFVTSIPFTPSVGRRIIIKDGLDKLAISRLIFEKVQSKAEALGVSSWHILFPKEEEHKLLTSIGISPRVATQFHWYNNSYTSFSDFLAGLNARKRKAIKKERKQIKDEGIIFRQTDGADISETQWSDFYLFYQTTYLARGMQGYLDIEFFRKIGETMPEQILLINAAKDNRDIAAALFFKSKGSLFGRYWGSCVEQQFLHFETCYYQGQEYAIENNLTVFDSGAQGEHKIQRGFEPIYTHSNHWIADQNFSRAIRNFLEEERGHIDQYKIQAESLLPFKKQ